METTRVFLDRRHDGLTETTDVEVADRWRLTHNPAFRWFAIEASDLGLAPGRFPTVIDTDLGNRKPLVRFKRDAHGTVHYFQPTSPLIVRVLND